MYPFSPPFKEKFLFFLFLFSATVVIGSFFSEPMMQFFAPSIEQMVEKAGSIEQTENFLLSLSLFIFLKNSSVVAMILAFGRFLIIPVFVIIINGLMVGALVTETIQAGANWLTTIMYILPHGIIEIPVVLAACAMLVNLKEVFFIKRVLIGFKYLIIPLALAAAIEVYITPIIANMV